MMIKCLGWIVDRNIFIIGFLKSDYIIVFKNECLVWIFVRGGYVFEYLEWSFFDIF